MNTDQPRSISRSESSLSTVAPSNSDQRRRLGFGVGVRITNGKRTEPRTKNHGPGTFFLLLLLTTLLLPLAPSTQAYPPAPHHLIYGTVRDELGNPIAIETVEVIFESLSGAVIKTTITPGEEAGVNYLLQVPMDAGLTGNAYQPTALQPTVGFRMWVKSGNQVFRPIEMNADYSHLGQPGQKTRLDLTLGEDSDGDGIPDAWERALLKPGQTLADIKPGDDSDGDGMSNLNEYLAGNYAFDNSSGFALKVAGFADGSPIVEFTGITGRTYTVLGSTDLKSWQTVRFRFEDEADAYAGLYVSEIGKVRVVVVAGETAPRYFRLMVR